MCCRVVCSVLGVGASVRFVWCVGVGVGVHSVLCMSWGKFPPCAGSKGLRVCRRNARVLNTCGRFAGTHGGVLNLHTGAC